MTTPQNRQELREAIIFEINRFFPYYGDGDPWDRSQYLATANFILSLLDEVRALQAKFYFHK